MNALAALVVELTLVLVLGEAAGRWLYRTSLLHARLPEVAFITGMAGWAVFGYAALVMSLSAQAIVPTVLMVGLGLYLYRPSDQPLPAVLDDYRKARGRRPARLALALIAAGALVAGVTATPELTAVSLAANGFPLRDPASPARFLIGPIGTAIYAAGIVRLFPGLLEPALAVDAALQFAFLGLSALLLSRQLLLLVPLAITGLLFPPWWLALGGWLQGALWTSERRALAAALMVACGAASRVELTLAGVLLLAIAGRRSWRLTAALSALALSITVLVYVSVLRGEAEQSPDTAWLRRTFLSAFQPPRLSSANAERRAAYRHIEREVPLWSRLVTYSGEAWVPDRAALRTGTAYPVQDPQPGWLSIVPLHPLPADPRTAVWANDYLLLPAALDTAAALCGGPERWRGETLVLREVTAGCRTRLFGDPRVARTLDMADRRLRLPPALARAGDPAKLPADLLALVVIDQPVLMYRLRHALENLWNAGKLEEARHALEPVLRDHPQLPEANYSMAYTLHIGGNPRAAIAYYDRALANGYEEFWVRFNRGAARLAAGDPLRARTDLERAIALKPEQPGPRELLAKLPATGTRR